MKGFASIPRWLLAGLLVFSYSISLCADDASPTDDVEKIKYQLRRNPGLVFSEDIYNTSPTFIAAATEAADDLLSSNPELATKADAQGQTALHWAAAHGNQAMCALLIQHGVDANIRDQKGVTPLHTAAANGHRNTSEYLLAHGAQINAIDKSGMTPFDEAVQANHIAMIEWLLDHQADVHAGTPPLFFAVECNNPELAAFLLNHQVGINDHFAANGPTALHIAAGLNNKPMVNWLLAHGADIHATDSNNQTPFSIAFGKGYYPLATRLFLLAQSRLLILIAIAFTVLLLFRRKVFAPRKSP